MTPDELARSLGIESKTLRAWLRRTGARSPAEHGQRWVLDQQQVAAAMAHFAGRPTTRAFKMPGHTGQGGKSGDEGPGKAPADC